MSLESRKGVALEDPGAEVVDQLTGFWDKYGRVLLGAIGAVVVIAVVAVFTMRSNAKQENDASKKLAEANLLFWQGDYDRSKTVAQEAGRTFGSTWSGTDAHRIAGDDMFWRGDFKGAITEYNAYLAKQGSGLLADAVRRSLAYSLESDKKFTDAAKLYDGLVGKFERESSAEFLAASARCYEANHQNDEAAKRLQRLLDEFGDTSYASRARVQLAMIQPPTN